MRGFLFRLIPTRPDFAFTLTDEERAAMAEHFAYWSGLLERGQAVAFGPVNDPSGPYGLGIVLAANIEEAEVFRDGDPVISPPLGFRTEIVPMLSLVTSLGHFEGT
jgi:uncharacterized protein